GSSTLVMGDDGWLYWLVRHDTGRVVYQLDPTSLAGRHWRRVADHDPAGVAATAPGPVGIGDFSLGWKIAYSDLPTPTDGQVWDAPSDPPTFGTGYRRESLGADGGVSDYDETHHECAGSLTAHRGADGTSYTRDAAALLSPVGSCELRDVDALPDGE